METNNYVFTQLRRCKLSHLLTFSIFAAILLLSSIFSIYFGFYIILLLNFSFIFGCASTFFLLNNKTILTLNIQSIRNYLIFKHDTKKVINDCSICGTLDCSRHLKTSNCEQWQELSVTCELDEALDSFYTKIINAFVESWFSSLSKNVDFVQALKFNFREATCRLVIKLKEDLFVNSLNLALKGQISAFIEKCLPNNLYLQLNIPVLIANQVLPCILTHHEIIQGILKDKIPTDRLPHHYQLKENSIHPAVRNRQTELDYLRAVAKCLMPQVSNNQNLNSKVFFSLIRELLACWVLLPLMDVLSDPNWFNSLIIALTASTTKQYSTKSSGDCVKLLKKFAERNGSISKPSENDEEPVKSADEIDTSFLHDQEQLYMFMQFLKREGGVDVLRFYLDVDILNNEVMEPSTITDPAKLSSLQKQSEALLSAYKNKINSDSKKNVNNLSEAQEDVKKILHKKWNEAFHLAPEYFRMVYGSREIRETKEFRNFEIQGNTVSRLGLKLKGAIRGAIDGAPLEATEAPTVWDAFSDESQSGSSILTGNMTIYNSVTQKLRKERGQNLDPFIFSFMQSVEQNASTDIGEDVILIKDSKNESLKPEPPGRNVIFGDLFEIKSSSNIFKYSLNIINHPVVRGPSQCLIYILINILNMPRIINRFLLGCISISRTTVDALILKLIDKTLKSVLHETHLTQLVNILDEQLFDTNDENVSTEELLERQRQARKRLAAISKKSCCVIDTLQSPILNKHLIYCLFDMIVIEIFPELENIVHSKN